MTNPMLTRARAYRLELRCRCCQRTFHPTLAEIDGRLIVNGCCARCRPETGAPRPEPTVRSPRLAKTGR
jgi:hypothetical protein